MPSTKKDTTDTGWDPIEVTIGETTAPAVIEMTPLPPPTSTNQDTKQAAGSATKKGS